MRLCRFSTLNLFVYSVCLKSCRSVEIDSLLEPFNNGFLHRWHNLSLSSVGRCVVVARCVADVANTRLAWFLWLNKFPLPVSSSRCVSLRFIVDEWRIFKQSIRRSNRSSEDQLDNCSSIHRCMIKSRHMGYFSLSHY